MRTLHRLLVVTLLSASATALLACGSEKKASEDTVYTLKGNGFTVRIPGKPERKVVAAETSAGAVPIITYLSSGGGEGFSLSVLRVPKGVKADLDSAMKGIATNVKGTLRNHRRTTYQGFEARDARIDDARDPDDKKGTVFARVILAKGKVFQLQYATDKDITTSPLFTRFAASLRIK